MKITKVEIFEFVCEGKPFFRVIGCRVHTDEGICGDGEAALSYGVGASAAFGMVKDLYFTQEEDKFNEVFERIKKYEDISDRMESEIAQYLGKVSDAHLSDDTKAKIREMLRQIGELESVGDSFYNLARILRRKRDEKIVFTDDQVAAGTEMTHLVEAAMTQMNNVLSGHREDFKLSDSEDIERKINELRDALRVRNIQEVENNVYSYEAGNVFMDMISECEKTGDYVMNVVEARLGEKSAL